MELQTGDKVVVNEDIKIRLYSMPDSERMSIPREALEDAINDRCIIVSRGGPLVIHLEGYSYTWPAHFLERLMYYQMNYLKYKED